MLILCRWKKFLTASGEKTLVRIEDSAILKYLKIVEGLNVCGKTSFECILPKTGDRAILFVSLMGVSLLRVENCEVLGSYRFGYELREWYNVGLQVKFKVKASRNADPKEIGLVCIQTNDVLTTITLYDEIRKTSKAVTDVKMYTADEDV